MPALNLLSIFLFTCIVHGEGALNPSSLTIKRSKRWDAYIQSLKNDHELRRSRRQAGANEWQSNRDNCNPAEYTINDSLGNRQSGLLVEPENQANCGSCWAFASAHALTDQLSLNQGSRHPLLSAGYLNSCFKNQNFIVNGNGCCGGKLYAGLEFIVNIGTVAATCSPYDPTSKKIALPSCPLTCSDNSSLNLSSFTSMGYKFLNYDHEIMDALTDGSVVMAAMSVTDEFDQYKCGVYRNSGSSTSVRGKHAVVIVDYGRTAAGTDFWVVKNSWGTEFGENGYFRIKRGELEIGRYGNAVRLRLDATNSTVTSQDFSNTSTITTCTETPVSSPANDEMVMSAVEFLQEELIATNLVSCVDGTRATGLRLTNSAGGKPVMAASIQVVAGTRLDIVVTMDVIGCTTATKADITTGVVVDLNGGFTLQCPNISTSNDARTFATLSLPWLLLCAIVVTTFVQV